MKKQNNKEKHQISNVSRAVLSLLVVGFTIISILNVYKFLVVLFGLSMAILISSTLEITRLACLYTFISSKKGIRSLAVATYVIVVMVIIFGNINSFTYEIIKRDRASQGQYREQVQKIKQAYSKRIEQQIATLDRDVAYIEKMVAKYPNSGYWKRRLERSVANRGKLVTRRDTFLATHPENPGQWVTAKSAMLGLKLEKPSSESEDMLSVTQALKELFGLEKTTAQKIVGIVVTVTVELSIILLSFLSYVKDKQRSVAGVVNVASVAKVGKKSHGVAKSREMSPGMVSVADIDEESMEKFVEANREHFEQTGKLLPMKKLNKNLRPIRKVVMSFNQENLKELFAK